MPLNEYVLLISFIIKAIFSSQIGLEMTMNYTVPRFTGKTRITGKTTKIPERPKNNREILICPLPIKKTIIDYWILLIFDYLVYI